MRLKNIKSKFYCGNCDYELETANALWVQEGCPIKDEYIFNVKKIL
ncbi:MAG: hypothetical protein QM426_12290 [Euryarchaeota archaeon]|nr:hypothetical protein [Euryarchaeota archaeon]